MSVPCSLGIYALPRSGSMVICSLLCEPEGQDLLLENYKAPPPPVPLWGFKEVTPLGMTKARELHRPTHEVLLVRHPGHAFMSFEKAANNNYPWRHARVPGPLLGTSLRTQLNLINTARASHLSILKYEEWTANPSMLNDIFFGMGWALGSDTHYLTDRGRTIPHRRIEAELHGDSITTKSTDEKQTLSPRATRFCERPSVQEYMKTFGYS